MGWIASATAPEFNPQPGHAPWWLDRQLSRFANAAGKADKG